MVTADRSVVTITAVEAPWTKVLYWLARMKALDAVGRAAIITATCSQAGGSPGTMLTTKKASTG